MSKPDAFFDFAEICESDAKEFYRYSPESVEGMLKETLAGVFGVQAAQTLSPIYPIVIFRLSTWQTIL